MTVKLIEDAMKTYIVVEDNGIGIFKKIKNDLSLQDEHQSLLELAKGKFTSNPKNIQAKVFSFHVELVICF